ncbi:UNVERIFIED_CONTAM: hypothetical protein GTU68_031674, partial [Idotea baltica]|nr:hypothetical protein [Idotea baltica]
VEVEDIAHGLARVARWNGQTTGPHAYSVAQHSVLVEHICSQLQDRLTPTQRLTALLHDAPEYVVGDMISPFKALLGESYKEIESRLQEAIHIRFGLQPITPGRLKRIIKKADHISAWFEATQLAGFSKTEATKLFGKVPDGISLTLKPVSADEAQAGFLARFSEVLNHVELERRR